MRISPTSLLWVISMISMPMAIKNATNPIIFFIYGKLLFPGRFPAWQNITMPCHLIILLYAASPQIFQIIAKEKTLDPAYSILGSRNFLTQCPVTFMIEKEESCNILYPQTQIIVVCTVNVERIGFSRAESGN